MLDTMHWNDFSKATCNTCYHNQCALSKKRQWLKWTQFVVMLKFKNKSEWEPRTVLTSICSCFNILYSKQSNMHNNHIAKNIDNKHSL